MKNSFCQNKIKTYLIPVLIFISVLVSCNRSTPKNSNNIYRPECKYSVTQLEHLLREIKKDSVGICLIGNSLVSRANWEQLLGIKHVVNWGIGGDEIPCIRDRSRLLAQKPCAVWVIEAGINDLQLYTEDTILNCFQEMISVGKNAGANIIITSVISVSKDAGSHVNGREEYKEVNALVEQVNAKLKTLSHQNNCDYIDLNKALCNSNGTLLDENTTDGVHLSEKAYKVWADSISNHIQSK